eukprot:TRINITY_DN2049_c0_g1_i9.p1 TRINITY_DN2049_c0_g1~~TRINITY_DN2049_c0_g1_i9.p1  ORF type:complete len:277 (+),score=46.87 TRINITY_DN2049_c0_g1_i9:3-833(+)
MAQQNVTILAESMRKLKEECKQAKQIATQESPMNDEVRAKFEELPNDLNEVRLQETEKRAQADAIICDDQQVLNRYQQLQVQVADYTEQMQNAERQQKTAEQDLDGMRQEWINKLKVQVGVINNTFQKSFSEIGCAGEVQVFEHPGGDFEKYGIQIMVQFREKEVPEVLSATRQSGGERSVATMLYLLSLQSITNCPFRVVDEINQGMDPINERKVFDLLVASSLRPDTPQCFVLTPKLLPDLDIKEGVRILLIMNGMQSGDRFQATELRELLPVR